MKMHGNQAWLWQKVPSHIGHPSWPYPASPDGWAVWGVVVSIRWWLLVDHCVLRNWDRILVRAVKGLISRAGMVWTISRSPAGLFLPWITCVAMCLLAPLRLVTEGDYGCAPPTLSNITTMLNISCSRCSAQEYTENIWGQFHKWV